jgi:2'-phosphotransferase
MNHQHIHFAKGMPGEVVSGMRDSSKVIIEIDVAKAMQDGIRFFESENGVILSDGIDGVILPVYFKNVIFK